MSTSLELFGLKFKELREKQGLSRQDLSDEAGVSMESIRRIETGIGIPKYETLYLLSIILRENLNKIYAKYTFKEYDEYSQIINDLEYKIDSYAFDDLINEKSKLENLCKNTENEYYSQVMMQYLILIEFFIAFNNKNINSSDLYEHQIEALSYSIPHFDIQRYGEYKYNILELRILMDIGIFTFLNYDEKRGFEIIKFCYDNIDRSANLYTKVAYNLAYTFIYNKDYETPLAIIDDAIDNAISNRLYNGLNLLYYNRGLCSYMLKKSDYREYFEQAVFFSNLIRQNKVRDMIVNRCNSILNVNDV